MSDNHAEIMERLLTHRTLVRSQPELGDTQRHVANQPRHIWTPAHHRLINRRAKDFL